MDSRTRRLNDFLKNYDKRLLARRDHKGVIHVYRERPICETFIWEGQGYAFIKPVLDYVISLTSDWTHEGEPCEWGLEPLWRKFLQMDAWRDDNGYARFVESRERYEKDKRRIQKNEFRARAADMRADFAKATNDIVVKQESLDRKRDY